jgi:hypothetical protein
VILQATAEELGDNMLLLVGDVFLSAACISYTGAFTGGVGVMANRPGNGSAETCYTCYVQHRVHYCSGRAHI